MKSERAVLTWYAFALFAVAVANAATQPVSSYIGASGTTGAVPANDNRYQYLLMDVYKMLYCDQKHCPNWRCQDDSAMIHGYCCGCPPAPLIGHKPMPCVQDIKCPLHMNDLCGDYHFMSTCCC